MKFNPTRMRVQKGAILPVVLLLGMGLMIGVAGVVNLGFVQEDLTRAERAAIDSAIATQYLTDYQHVQNSRTDNPTAAPIPFPSGSRFHDRQGASTSCFVLGASASSKFDYIRRGWGGWGPFINATLAASAPAGQTREEPFSIGEVVPVFASAVSVPGQTGGQSYALTEYKERDVHYLTIASGAGNRIELRRLGETDVDRFFAHFWFRFEGLDDLDEESMSLSAPILTIASGLTATPKLQWIITANSFSSSAPALTGYPSQFEMSLSFSGLSGAVGVSQPAAIQVESEPAEWFAASVWFNGASNSTWYQIRHRGVPNTDPLREQFVSSPVGITIDRDGDFFIGSASTSVAAPFQGNVDWPVNIATVRVWLEPDISTELEAASVANSIFEMDTYRPGDFFSTVSLDEPDSYVTLDSEDGLVSVNGDQLITSEWQPLFGQPVAVGTVSPGAESPERVGGNPDSIEPLERGGPPSSTHYYVYHSCDQNNYQFVQRTRKYTRGANSSIPEVRWLEE